MEKKTAPNAVPSLVLGIVSIVICCIPILNLACGIIGLILAMNGKKAYVKSPEEYTGYGMLNAGFILSIIGTALSAIYLIYYVIVVLIIGSAGIFSLGNLLNA